MPGWSCALAAHIFLQFTRAWIPRWHGGWTPAWVSRWLLDSRAGLDELLGHVGEACSSSALRRIRQSLAALGVESTSCLA
ncbi:MAG TPA: hypothetical protein VK988_14370 [Acidimicrobiales bacterium]|nr:hypothetical protein [Acidimicrobiales bacterium]